MTDFAKEARDLRSCGYANYAEQCIWLDCRSLKECRERDDIEALARRMHAAGVAAGMAKAAEIARAYGAAERLCAIQSTRVAVVAEGSAQYRAATWIAKAILAASPTVSDAPRPE